MSLRARSEGLVGINQQINDVVLSDDNILRDYKLTGARRDINLFLSETGFENRRERAMSISKKALQRHGKEKSLHPFLSRLATIETGVQQYHPMLRDHITHSVYVFLLGLLFISKLDSFRIDALSWKIASLLHDIGLPLQLFSFSMKKYLNLVHKEKLKVSNQRLLIPICYSTSIRGLEGLRFNEVDAFASIGSRLQVWGFDLDLKNIHQQNQNQGRINHGILSALIVTNIIDNLYMEKNPLRQMTKTENGIDWGRRCFDTQILDAVSAIAMHDLLENVQGISLENSPITYLLVLCDNLQEWDRYSPGQRVYDPFSININFDGNQVVCRLSLPESKIRKLRGVRSKLQTEAIDLRIQTHSQ